MTITRRDAMVGFAALAGTITSASGAAAQEPQAESQKPVENQKAMLRPAVFHWDDLKPEKSAVGAHAFICQQPTATVDQLEMHVGMLNPGETSHPPHRHVNEELIILKEGTCETLSNGQWVRVEAGSVVFNASNSLHGFRNIGQWPALYHVVNWSPNKARNRE